MIKFNNRKISVFKMKKLKTISNKVDCIDILNIKYKKSHLF